MADQGGPQKHDVAHPPGKGIGRCGVGGDFAQPVRAQHQVHGFAQAGVVHNNVKLRLVAQHSGRAARRIPVQRAHFRPIAGAHEFRRKPVDGREIDAPRAVHLLQLAVVKNGYPVGHGHGFFLVVGHIDGGDAEALLYLADFFAHGHAQFGVQVGQGLVHEQHVGADDQGAGQGHALLLPA